MSLEKKTERNEIDVGNNTYLKESSVKECKID
jgi:hypothetical protein